MLTVAWNSGVSRYRNSSRSNRRPPIHSREAGCPVADLTRKVSGPVQATAVGAAVPAGITVIPGRRTNLGYPLGSNGAFWALSDPLCTMTTPITHEVLRFALIRLDRHVYRQ